MGNGLPIETHPVPIETPGQSGILKKPTRVGQSDEIEPQLLIQRIGSPEPLFAAKIGQTTVDPHTGASTDQARIGRRDRFSGAVKGMVDHQASLFVGPNRREVFGSPLANAVIRKYLVGSHEGVLMVEDDGL